jgi:hypothetical protein
LSDETTHGHEAKLVHPPASLEVAADIVPRLAEVFMYPGRFFTGDEAAPEHEAFHTALEEVEELSQDDLEAVLCGFFFALKAEGYSDGDISAFWDVWELPVPPIPEPTPRRVTVR